MTFCFDGVQVEGIIEKYGGNTACSGSQNNGIPGVEFDITIEPGGSADCGSLETNSAGSFSCDVFRSSYNYLVKPKKENNSSCAITSLDLGLLQGHLELSSYGQLIAADYNLSGNLSTTDKVMMHKHILGYSGFEPTKSWRFLSLKIMETLLHLLILL